MDVKLLLLWSLLNSSGPVASPLLPSGNSLGSLLLRRVPVVSTLAGEGHGPWTVGSQYVVVVFGFSSHG